MKTATPKKLADGTWGALVNNKHNETISVDDDILIMAASGKTWIATITEVVDGNLVRTKAYENKVQGRTCPNCHTEMPLVKKGKGFKKYGCTCGAWATQNKSKWYYSEYTPRPAGGIVSGRED